MEDAIRLNLIRSLEEALIQEEEHEEAVGLMVGRMGAKIMGTLEEGAVIDDDDLSWERVEVDVLGYRLMGDPSFQKHFRMSKNTYEVLVHTLANFLLDTGKVLRIRNSIDIPLLMVLWILANPDSFRSVALRFGVRPGCVHFHYAYMIEAFREMTPKFIKWPDEEERNQIKDRFLAYSGFPGIIGVADGTYNVVTAPSIQPDKFRNRHHTYAFNTLAICDDNLLIRHIHVGEVGSMHDQRVFRRSPLYKKLIDNDGSMLQMDEHLIGDSAYGIRDFMMVPFRNVGNLSPEQRAYNYALCKSRARIEHAFGKAFGQWRRMKMLHSCNIELAVDHITSCFVLHNFMILNGEKLIDLEPGDGFVPDEEDLEDEPNVLDEDLEDNQAGHNFNLLENQARLRGIEKRIQIVTEL